MNVALLLTLPLQITVLALTHQEPPKIFTDAVAIEQTYGAKAKEARAKAAAISVEPSKDLVKEWEHKERARILENSPKIPVIRSQIRALMPNLEARKSRWTESSTSLIARRENLNAKIAELDGLMIVTAQDRMKSRHQEIEAMNTQMRNLQMRVGNMTAAQKNRSKKDREKFAAIIANDSKRLEIMSGELSSLESKQSEDLQTIVQRVAPNTPEVASVEWALSVESKTEMKDAPSAYARIANLRLEVDTLKASISEQEVKAEEQARLDYEQAKAEVDQLEQSIADLHVPADTEVHIPQFLTEESKKFRKERQAEIDQFQVEATAHEAEGQKEIADLFLNASKKDLNDEFWDLDQGWTKLNAAISAASTALSAIGSARNSISRAQDDLQDAKRAEVLEAAAQLTKSDKDCNNMWTQGSAINSSIKTERADRAIRNAQAEIQDANYDAELFERRAEDAGQHMRTFINSRAQTAHIPQISGFNTVNRIDSAATWMNAHDGYTKGITQVGVMLGLRKAGSELNSADNSLYSMASSISSAQSQLERLRDDIPQMKSDLLTAYNKNLHKAFNAYKSEAGK